MKPFDPEELVAVRAVLRRKRPRGRPGVQFGDLVVDVRSRLVTRAGLPVPLTATEFKMPGLLVRDRARVESTVQIVGHVWGHMSSLPRKLEEHGSRISQTVRGRGTSCDPHSALAS